MGTCFPWMTRGRVPSKFGARREGAGAVHPAVCKLLFSGRIPDLHRRQAGPRGRESTQKAPAADTDFTHTA